MKTIKNIQNLSLSEFLFEMYYSDKKVEVLKTDMYNHIKKLTANFDGELLQMAMDDILSFWHNNILYQIDGQEISLHQYDVARFLLGSQRTEFENINLGGITVEESTLNNEQCYRWEINENSFKRSEKNNAALVYSYLDMVIHIYVSEFSISEFVKWANAHLNSYFGIENLNNKINPSREIINPQIKRPQNTLKKQIALLEHTGIIDYLISKYGKNDLQLSEIISNILNRDKQNIRELISLSSTINSQSNNENKDFVNEFFAKCVKIE